MNEAAPTEAALNSGLDHAKLVSAPTRTIAGFIGFAFRQGTKVKPDKTNTDNWERFGGPPDSHTGSGM
jgi:hypothetical protein